MNSGILLEAGTNEVEILELRIGGASYGINVLKIRQVLKYNAADLHEIPGSSAAMTGSLIFQEQTVNLVDLRLFFSCETPPVSGKEVVVVAEFNEKRLAFLVDGLEKINRIQWDQLQSPPYMMHRFQSNITGVITIDEREVLMLDVENIAVTLFGDSFIGIHSEDDHCLDERETAEIENKDLPKLIFCDDSAVIRQQMEMLFIKKGFKNISVFVNGKQALDEVLSITARNKMTGKPLTEGIGAVVTDLEMPVMDGFTLCKKVKEISSEIPVFIVSSLITAQTRQRCEGVFADHAFPKNKAGDIIKHLVDHFRA